MTTKEYETKDFGKIKITRYEVKEAYTNGFAQRVLKLENGTEISISYGEDEVEIKEVVK